MVRFSISALNISKPLKYNGLLLSSMLLLGGCTPRPTKFDSSPKLTSPPNPVLVAGILPSGEAFAIYEDFSCYVHDALKPDIVVRKSRMRDILLPLSSYTATLPTNSYDIDYLGYGNDYPFSVKKLDPITGAESMEFLNKNTARWESISWLPRPEVAIMADDDGGSTNVFCQSGMLYRNDSGIITKRKLLANSDYITMAYSSNDGNKFCVYTTSSLKVFNQNWKEVKSIELNNASVRELCFDSQSQRFFAICDSQEIIFDDGSKLSPVITDDRSQIFFLKRFVYHQPSNRCLIFGAYGLRSTVRYSQ